MGNYPCLGAKRSFTSATPRASLLDAFSGHEVALLQWLDWQDVVQLTRASGRDYRCLQRTVPRLLSMESCDQSHASVWLLRTQLFGVRRIADWLRETLRTCVLHHQTERTQRGLNIILGFFLTCGRRHYVYVCTHGTSCKGTMHFSLRYLHTLPAGTSEASVQEAISGIDYRAFPSLADNVISVSRASCGVTIIDAVPRTTRNLGLLRTAAHIWMLFSNSRFTGRADGPKLQTINGLCRDSSIARVKASSKHWVLIQNNYIHQRLHDLCRGLPPIEGSCMQG